MSANLVNPAFDSAAKQIAALNLKSPFPQETMAFFYGLYKQATVGDNPNPTAPWKFISPTEYGKWEAWNKWKGLSKEEAQRKYIEASKTFSS